MKRTPLYQYHLEHGKMVEFAGYELPVWYTSISDEHLAVRNGVGIFDVSHMGRVIVSGDQADAFVEGLVPTSSSSQATGKSFYTLMLNFEGGIIDDLIVMKGARDYLLVINAANRTKDLDHMFSRSSAYRVTIEDITEDTAMIAVQGPSAIRALQPLTRTDLSELKRFTHTDSEVGGVLATITRTGYTGEDGFEVILRGTGVDTNAPALSVWDQLAEVAKPCGLGARDSLRIESGLPLYGSDIDETTNPIEADLKWVISKDKTGYLGEESIKRFSGSVPRRFRRGLVLEERIPRHGFEIKNAAGGCIGDVTSGTFSPILRKGIALGYMDPAYAQPGQKVEVAVRDYLVAANVVRPPFYDQNVYGWKRTGQHTI